MANDNKALLSPVGAVWKYLRNNNPGISLYQSDESHPTLAGSYAAACCFYALIIFGQILRIISFPYTVYIVVTMNIAGMVSPAFLKLSTGLTQLLVIVELDIRVSHDLKNLVKQPASTPTLGRSHVLEKHVDIEAKIRHYYFTIFTSIMILMATAITLPIYSLCADPDVLLKN